MAEAGAAAATLSGSLLNRIEIYAANIATTARSSSTPPTGTTLRANFSIYQIPLPHLFLLMTLRQQDATNDLLSSVVLLTKTHVILYAERRLLAVDKLLSGELFDTKLID
jgi:hypothetical protein